jgi:predicted Zn-dependent protease
MTRTMILLSLLLGACAATPQRPELAACMARMEAHAANLRPAFAALGHRPEVYLRLDEDLADSRGFRKGESTLGDASPGGTIRLRPSRLCADEVLARAVVAHEMAHVSLQHRGVPGSGVTALWEKPAQQEIEADELAYAALMRAGGDARAAMLVSCWLGKCERPGKPDLRWRGW